MKKHSISLAAIGALSLLSAGCSTAQEPASAPTAPVVESIAPSASPSPIASTGPKKSARGNYVKNVGETSSMWTGNDKKTTVVFTINSITVDPACTTPHAVPAEKGHFVVLDASIESTPDLANASFTRFDLSPHTWQLIGANGTTFNGSLASGPSYSCFDESEVLPINGVGPGEKVTGKIVLDVPVATGTLMFKPLGGSSGGWEWTF